MFYALKTVKYTTIVEKNLSPGLSKNECIIVGYSTKE
jgi:hypothetical protein